MKSRRMFVGHQDLVKDFKQLAGAGRLAHAYLFFGESEVGKFYFAKHLANFLENGEWEIAQRPLQDALLLNSVSGIEEMRSLQSFLWRKPIFSKRRLAVLNDADNLTLEAQNAILKIVEEPPEHSLIILVVRNAENLLPALQSRLQKIYFGRLSGDEMQAVTSDPEILAQALGRPGKAVKILNRNSILEDGRLAAKQFLDFAGSRRSAFIKELVEEQKENPALLDAFFEALILELYKNKLQNWELLKEALHRLFLIKSYNTNKRLQLEAISHP